MFRRAVHVMTVRQIEVRLDPSLLVIALLVAWTFANRFGIDHGTVTGWTMGVAGTLLFFASILAHELGHALEARHRGIEVHGITLFLFGGVTEMGSHGHRPRDEFAIAAVGPWISLLCGAVFGLVATGAVRLPGAIGAPIADVTGLLGWLNVALALFNLVPGAPLDGGRVLRAGLWWLLGSRHRAIRITAWLGQALGVAVVGFGAWVYAATPASIVGAIWYWVIGVFLFTAARGELRAAKADELFTRWSVGEVFGTSMRFHDDMGGRLAVPPSSLPRVHHADDLHHLVAAFQHDHDVIAVDLGDGALGLLSEQQAARGLTHLRRTGQPDHLDASHLPAGSDR
jgi:Zn-dependent protease